MHAQLCPADSARCITLERLASSTRHSCSTSQRHVPVTEAATRRRSRRRVVGRRQVVARAAAGVVDAPVLDNNSQPSQPKAAKHAVVAGAGPAGAVAALYLARQGYHVDVFERRPEPQDDQVNKARSYIIALTGRGLSALADCGINAPRVEAAYLGSVTHPARGRPRVGKSDGALSFERVELTQLLINEARRLAPAGCLTFHFEAPLQGIDFKRRMAKFGGAQGDSREVPYDLLVGADGANSVVRRELAAFQPHMTVREEDSGRQYKTWRNLTAAPGLEPPEFEGRPGRTLHLFLGSNSLTSVSAHRNADGTYGGTLALKNGDFERLRSAEDYEALIRQQLPSVPPVWATAIAQQAVTAPASSTGKRVRCSQLHGPGCVLIGDAAHAVTPVGGQGCNAALEDCAVLDRVLQDAGGDPAVAAEAWTPTRGADAKALGDIEASFYKLVGGRKLGFLDPGFLRLVAHIGLGTLLHKALPWFFEPPALMRLGSRTPYSAIQRRITQDALVAAALLAITVAFLVLKGLHVI